MLAAALAADASTSSREVAPLARALAAMDAPFSVATRRPRERWERVDPDVLAALGERIMTLSAEVNAATYQLLALIAEFDRLEAWKGEGYACCAAWLAHRTHINKRTAREKVRVARALAELPKTSQAMGEGRLSYSQVRAITRAADPDSEEEALRYADTMTADQLDRLMRSWKRLDRDDELKLEERIHRARTLSIFPDEEGGYVMRAQLEADAGALLLRAIEAASDELYRGSVPETTPEQRRADALVLLAERALEAGLGGGGSAGPRDARETEHDEEESEAGSAEPAARAEPREKAEPGVEEEREGGSAEPPTRRGGAERYMVFVHVDADRLSGDADRLSSSADVSDPPAADPLRPHRAPHLDDGTRLATDTARRLSCDASVVRVLHRRRGRVIEVEGKRRTVPMRLRRALEIRDRGCRFPGCGSRFTQVHHIHHWANGGATTLDNCTLLCKAHHRLLHEGGFSVEADPQRPGRLTFYGPRGHIIPEVPPQMTIDGKPVGRGECGSAGERRCRRGPPRWEHDVPLAFYLRALAALE